MDPGIQHQQPPSSPVVVDVVIVTYDSADDIEASIRALRACADREGVQASVVVVDNGSTDDTTSVAAEHADAVLTLPDNPGFAAACNVGARQGDADLILFLNPDTEWQSGLRALLETATHPDVGIAGPRLVRDLQGTPDRAGARSLPTLGNVTAHALRLRGPRGYNLHVTHDEPTQVGAVNGACLAIARRHFEAVGGWCEQYWMYGEDLDLCAEVAKRDLQVVHVGTARCLHRKAGSTGGRRPPFLRREFLLAMGVYVRRQAPMPRPVVPLAVMAVRVAATLYAMLRKVRGQPLTPARTAL